MLHSSVSDFVTNAMLRNPNSFRPNLRLRQVRPPPSNRTLVAGIELVITPNWFRQPVKSGVYKATPVRRLSLGDGSCPTRGRRSKSTFVFQWTNETKRYKKKSGGPDRCSPDELARRLIPVLNEERRRAILDLLTHQGRVLVTELSRQFETSQVTIRKDLEILHAHGLVHRTHGGALPSREGALEDPTLREKEKLHHQEKMRIAENAPSRK